MYSFPLIHLSRVSLFSFRVRLCVVVYARWFRWLSCRRLSSGMYLLVFMWDCTACSDTFVWKVNSSPVGGERERERERAEHSCLKTRRVWSCTSSDTRKNFPSFFPSPHLYLRVYGGGVWNCFSCISHPEWLWNEEREFILTRQRANRVSAPRAALFKRICPAFDGKYFCVSEG